MDFSRVVGLHKSVVDCYKAWGQKRADRAAEKQASTEFADPELVHFVFETSGKRAAANIGFLKKYVVC